jgi:hypothetical protein
MQVRGVYDENRAERLARIEILADSLLEKLVMIVGILPFERKNGLEALARGMALPELPLEALDRLRKVLHLDA